ncbi:MAG: P-II family nitrogen regulator [Candidatus Aminicenantes bacterium]|nr:MAG: P-II family nitrogen regulator [Candidatus Aminicenantes bacterium]
MKLIKAYLRQFLASEVIAALKEINAPRLTALEIKSLGDEIDPNQLHLSAELSSSYTPMVKIELVCSEAMAAQVKEIILNKAHTGYKGDGLIAILPVEEAVSIRTRENEKE